MASDQCTPEVEPKKASWYDTHPEARRAAKRRWASKNRDKVRGEQRRSYAKIQADPVRRRKHIEHCRSWQKRNPDKVKEQTRRFHLKRRMEALAHYSGGTMRCACCGESEVQFLGIDHVDGDGAAHRRSISGKNSLGGRIYTWLRQNGYPAGFQVLCHNCNCAKGFYGVCPHERARQARIA
jgi:hypothetical protein